MGEAAGRGEAVVEEVKALPETLVLIMEGGPSSAEGVLEVLKVKTHRRQTGCTGMQGSCDFEAQNKAGTGPEVM